MKTKAERPRIAGLYAVTRDATDTAALLAAVRSALRGGAAWLQYRNKGADADLRLDQARALRQLCTELDRPLIVNDDVELALAVAADGVHLGAADGSVAEARRRLGPERLVGVSCYDQMAVARRAVAEGADHVAFGSVFASAVKPGAVRAPLSLIAEARRELGVPVVAIGGITAANAGAVIAAGADAIAVISAVFDAQDVETAARSLAALFAPAHPASAIRRATG